MRYTRSKAKSITCWRNAAAGLSVDKQGLLQVNEYYQTEIPHIYAAGDVIGFPALAATSMEQGRLATCHAFKVIQSQIPKVWPYGIYTIPEISTVGKTEEELTAAAIPYEIGRAFYKEIARGQIIGDLEGLMKLISTGTPCSCSVSTSSETALPSSSISGKPC